MRTLNYLSLLLLSIVFLSACTTDTLYDVGGAAVGGLAGNEIGDGDPLITAAGAGVGVLGTTFVRGQAAKARDKSFNDGYNKGRSDSIKQQYWIRQNLQKELSDKENESKVSYVPYSSPQRQLQDGTILEPQTHYIRVEN